MVDERLYVRGPWMFIPRRGRGKGWRGQRARAEKNCRAGKRQAGRGMFESVGKRESDQLGTNVRERGLGGVTGLRGISVYTSPLIFTPEHLPFACTRRSPKRRFYLFLHLQDPDRFQLFRAKSRETEKNSRHR